MDKCMTMPGGGPFTLNAGQITDDSELAMCQMHALLESEEDIKNGTFDADKIAHHYRKWVGSGPFDIGQATSAALSALTREDTWASAAGSAARYN